MIINKDFGVMLGPKGLGRGGVYAMYSVQVTLWLRREQGYVPAQASTDKKAGRFSLVRTLRMQKNERQGVSAVLHRYQIF